MVMDWTITDEDKKLSEIAGKALHEERQRIQTDEGVVVLISEDELARIEGKPKSFKDHLSDFPKVDMDFERDKSPIRDIDGETKPRNPLIEYLKSGPGFEGVDVSRDQSPPRDIEW
jgi:hypothetical protein